MDYESTKRSHFGWIENRNNKSTHLNHDIVNSLNENPRANHFRTLTANDLMENVRDKPNGSYGFIIFNKLSHLSRYQLNISDLYPNIGSVLVEARRSIAAEPSEYSPFVKYFVILSEDKIVELLETVEK